ncbi:MAG TPA: hypothetical protein VM123_10215 [archaeon]|nr:hypothetical protein [archaeon]
MTAINIKCQGFGYPVFYVMTILAPQYLTVPALWAVGDDWKVYCYQTERRCSKTNCVWKGRTICLKGLNNRVLAFQVTVETVSFRVKKAEVSTAQRCIVYLRHPSWLPALWQPGKWSC